MQGLYYKTTYRNQKTGEAEFDFIPNERMENLDNGILHCRGVIGIYKENTPVEIEGEPGEKYYRVSRCFIPYKTVENAKHILNHISKEMTDNQIEKIAKESKGDIFRFINSEYGKIFTATVLKRDTNDRYFQNIIYKIHKLGLQEELVQELLKYQVPIDKIESLNKKDFSLKALDKDPYNIFLKYDIGIEIADRFAQRTNTKEYSIKRLSGFLLDSLLYLQQSGNSFTSLAIVTSVMNNRLEKYGVWGTKVNKSMVNACIYEMSKYVAYQAIGGKTYIYLNTVWEEECNIINHIFRLNNNKRVFEQTKTIEEIEEKIGIKYNREQRDSFNAVKSSGIKILTGPPGSGKTAVIRGLIEYFGNNGVVKLAATTGMAAKVMKDACKHSTETANMMLNVIPFNDSIKGKDLNDPVNADLIIVDEISMMGIQLFSVLVQAVKSGSILLLVGDENQLQSVDYGNVLHDLIDSGVIETYRLKEIIRSSGLICQNAGKINAGEQDLYTNDSFQIKKMGTNSDIIDFISHIDINQCQILTPLRKKGVCTKMLNQYFVKKKNPFVMAYGHREFHLNDRIIMTKTNYHKGYVNGDIGFVLGSEGECMLVKILHKTIKLEREDMQNVDFAYAITIHKSQGSEFKQVCIVLPEDAKNMMSRRLLYTAVTRSKEKVIILEMGNALSDAISNRSETQRRTLLSSRLKERMSVSGN